MNRRRYLRAAGTAGSLGLAGCLGSVSVLGDDNPNTVLAEPDRQEGVTSEKLPYPAWGQRVPDVTLSAPLSDRDVALADVDRPYFVTFIYTSCMTVCPVLVSTLREVQIHSVNEGYADDVAFYPVTFDPARDDEAALRAEAEKMNVDLEAGNWHFLRPADEAAAKSVVDDEFGVFFEKTEGKGNGNGYMFTHAALIVLANPDGYVERAYRGSQPDEGTLIEDLTRLRTGLE